MTDPRDLEIARLTGQVAALERALRRRSRELRLLQRYASESALRLIGAIASGHPIVAGGPHLPESWQETHTMQEADIMTSIQDLWDAARPLAIDLSEPECDPSP